MSNYIDLRNNGIHDLAVDGTQFLSDSLLGLVDELFHLVPDGRHLVTALGDNLGVVGRATAVPREKLDEKLASAHSKKLSHRSENKLTLVVSAGTSVRAPSVAMAIRFSFIFFGVISATAKAESFDG